MNLPNLHQTFAFLRAPIAAAVLVAGAAFRLPPPRKLNSEAAAASRNSSSLNTSAVTFRSSLTRCNLRNGNAPSLKR